MQKKVAALILALLILGAGAFFGRGLWYPLLLRLTGPSSHSGWNRTAQST
jgi:hypothetical protein